MPERPTGTVTFLFTDIEGSTRLLQQLRERYDDELSAHARLLREAIERFGGHVGSSSRTSVKRYVRRSGKCVQIPPPLLKRPADAGLFHACK
jgi:class 3 adenylate cyclase